MSYSSLTQSNSPTSYKGMSKRIIKLKNKPQAETEHLKAIYLLKADLDLLEKRIWDRALELDPSGSERDQRGRELLLKRIDEIRALIEEAE